MIEYMCYWQKDFFKLINIWSFIFDGSNSIRSRKILTLLCKDLNSLMTPETDKSFPRVPADCQLLETVWPCF